MSAQKRSQETADPDYADVGEQRVKRQRLVEQDAKETVSRKIQNIVQNEFQKEIGLKETELQNIDKKLNEALLQMDRLRACIVAAYFSQRHQSSSSNSQAASLNAPPPSIHPAVKKHLGKAPKGQLATKLDGSSQASVHATDSHERLRQKQQGEEISEAAPDPLAESQRILMTVPSDLSSTSSSLNPERRSRFKIKKKIIVGNVSKYIPVDNREANDMSSHKWMVYVRGPKTDPDISGYVRKVWFFLHHSYKPNDLVEVSSPPFHLTRRGWGEFPVRVQLHFVDSRNKKLDIIHHLKLDKTFTGLQTLGAETVVEVEIHPEPSAPGPSTPAPSKQLLTQHQAMPRSEKSDPSPELLKPSASSTTNTSSKHRNSNSPTDRPQADKTDSQTLSHEMDSSSRLLEVIKKEIVPSNDKEEGVHNKLLLSETQEYHMTIAHEPGPPLSKKIKEDPDQDVDVCADDDKIGEVDQSVVNVEPMTLSFTGSSVELKETRRPVLTEESMDTSVSAMQSSAKLSVITQNVSRSVTSSKEQTPHSSEPPKVSSTHLISQNLTLSSLAKRVQSSPLVLEDSSNGQPVKMTIIKDPLKRVSYLGQTSSSMTSAITTTAETLVSSTTTATCVISTITTTTTHLSRGCVTSSSSPFSVHTGVASYNSRDTTALPIRTVIHQQPVQGVAPSKLVVIKPNPNLPIKVVSRTTSPKTFSSTNRVTTLVSTASSVTQVDSPLLQSTQGHSPIVIGGSGKPVVIPSNPVHQPKPKSSRQVSLLTGLVVNNCLPSSPTVSPATSVLGSRSVVSHQIPAAPNTLNNQAKVRQFQSPQTAQVFVVNKPSAQAHSLINPGPISTINQTNTQGGRTLIKVLNKTSLPPSTPQTNAPIKIFSTPKTTYNSNSPVVNVQTLVAHSPQASALKPAVVRAQPAAEHANLAASTSSPQFMLSFPNGKATPLPTDLETCHFPKMSAVGITKHGKGYRSALTAQLGARKNLSQEDRLKGQYEVLRAFKENPELYQKKTKKVLATNDAIEGDEDFIPKLDLEDYPSLRSLLKAAVLLHPLVQHDVNKITHPYCAKSLEEWHSWPIGKQRAAEWHRASFTLAYLSSCLGGRLEFKGEELLSTRQLMDWCRLRAFSPVLPIKSLRPEIKGDIDEPIALAEIKSESPHDALRPSQVQSLTLSDGVHSLLTNTNVAELMESNERIDVVSDGLLPSLKKEETSETNGVKETSDEDQWLPLSQGATFVYDQLRKRGVRLQPQESETGVMACLPAELLFRSMIEFCSDVLRETLSVCDHPSREITSRDVLLGLTSLPEAAFCCNKYLGKKDTPDLELATSR